jgi:hypothetical protein
MGTVVGGGDGVVGRGTIVGAVVVDVVETGAVGVVELVSE